MVFNFSIYTGLLQLAYQGINEYSYLTITS